jgi:hypothetical protein
LEVVVKLTREESARFDALVRWYLSEAKALWKTAEQNIAFSSAAIKAMNGLNVRAETRLAETFDFYRVDYVRARELHTHFSAVVRERMNREVIPVEPDPSEKTLTNYLYATTRVLEGARKDTGAMRVLDGTREEEETGVRFARVLWAALRNARVFDIPIETFQAIYTATDRYTTEKIAKRPFETPGTELTKDDHEHFIESINEAGSRVPFPDPLPFEHTYFGFGFGVELVDHQIYTRLPTRDALDRVVTAAVLGMLVWEGPEGGNVVELVQVVEREDNYIMPNLVCYRGVWITPWMSLAPWLATHLVALVNEHRQIIVEQRAGLRIRKAFDKARKKLRVPGIVPKPYYLVRLEKKLIDDTGARARSALAKIARELSYRHDRRGHERCYVRRGKLPLEADDAAKMEKTGYRIWTVNEPDAAAYRQLMERGQAPKGAEEWIAVLTRWIDPQIVGPEDKPYIPAIRVPAKG